jgi:multisubunit Na+/H+ antiporter MnhG subunit
MDDNKSISNHILPTSASLLGFCFVILSFIQTLGVSDKTVIDELVAVAIVLFLTTCVLSYLSMRVKHRAASYEKAADIIFLAGLFLLTAASLLVVLKIVN